MDRFVIAVQLCQNTELDQKANGGSCTGTKLKSRLGRS